MLFIAALAVSIHPRPRSVSVVLTASRLHLLPDDTDPTTTTVPPTSVPPQAAALAVRWPQAPKHSGSRQACILSRENPTSNPYGRSTNPSHFGAYQFDKQTWAAAGGDPAHWGSASPAEQDAAFNNYVARYGYGAWAPYDGC